MKYSNYKTVNQQKDAVSVDWCLSAKPGKSYKQATVLFPDGKEYQYGTNYATAESDIVVVGNIFPRGQSYEVKNAATTGCMGVVTLMTPKITVPAGKVAELDFVFSQKVNKRMIAGCVAYLDAIGGLGGNNYTYGKINYFTGCIHPISISIRKTLAAASVLAHASLATPDDVKKAKDFIAAPKEIGLYAIDCEIYPEYVDIDFRDIQVDVDSKNEDELENLNPDVCEGVYYRGEGEKGEFDGINPYFDKYVNIGAVSIMVRGGFVNLLKAYLSAEPAIGAFYDEMLEAIGDNGYPEAIALLKEYHPAK